MDVIHAVDRAERLPDSQARAAPEAHARDLARRVADGDESVRVEHLVVVAASDAQVDVGHEPRAEALVERAEAPVGERARDLLFAHGAHGLAVDAEDIHAAVQVVAAVVGVVRAARLAHRGRHLVPLSLRVERPRERRAEALDVDARQHVRSSRVGPGRDHDPLLLLVNLLQLERADAAQEVVRAVGDDERAVGREAHARGLVEARLRAAFAVGEAGAAAPRDDARRAVGRDLHDAAPVQLGHVEKAVARDGEPDGLRQLECGGVESRRVRLSRRGRRGRAVRVLCAGRRGGRVEEVERGDLSVLRYLPQAVVAGVGDVDVAGLRDGHAAGRVEERGVERAAVGVARTPFARDGSDLPVFRDDADAVVVRVGDVDVPVLVNGHADGRVELAPSPASVVTTPSFVIFRTRLLPVSATYRFPSPSSATPEGVLKLPRPRASRRTPSGVSLRIEFDSPASVA